MNERELLRMTNMPVNQNKMFRTAAEAIGCPRGNVVISQNETTGFVRNIAFDAAKLEYDQSYQNEQGCSAAFQAHLSRVLQIIGEHFASRSILEVGCGKGAFLDHMRAAGHDAWGIDPAYEGNSPYITRALFGPDVSLRKDAVVMRHVLEHIPQPLEFLEAIKRANGGGGLIYIEVPCLDWILHHRAWFDVFYEHVNYFRKADFGRLFGAVLESGHLFGGQYLYAIAELGTLREPGPCSPEYLVEVPSGFLNDIDKLCRASGGSQDRIVWGCGAKGVMFAHHLSQRGFRLDLAVDINPAKQGKFLASSGIPILSPEDALARAKGGTDVYVMNSNYLPEIEAFGGKNLNYIPVDIQ